MKIYVRRTSDGFPLRGNNVREFESLEECINTLECETGEEEYVVSKPAHWNGIPEGVERVVEIYDDYRE